MVSPFHHLCSVFPCYLLQSDWAERSWLVLHNIPEFLLVNMASRTLRIFSFPIECYGRTGYPGWADDRCRSRRYKLEPSDDRRRGVTARKGVRYRSKQNSRREWSSRRARLRESSDQESKLSHQRGSRMTPPNCLPPPRPVAAASRIMPVKIYVKRSETRSANFHLS